MFENIYLRKVLFKRSLLWKRHFSWFFVNDKSTAFLKGGPGVFPEFAGDEKMSEERR